MSIERPAEAGLRLGGVAPVLGALGVPEAEHRVQPLLVDGRVGVHAAALQQRDTDLWIDAQAGGQDAAGGAGPNHHVVSRAFGQRALVGLLLLHRYDRA